MKHLAFLLMVLILILAAAACQTANPTDVERGSEQGKVEYQILNDGSALHFPRQPTTDGEQMQALLEGQLVLENGCLRVVTDEYKESGFLILWPSDAEVRTTVDGVVEVLDSSGQIAGRVDASISISGGAMENESVMVFWESQIDGLPIEGCPGPYWVAGELYPLAEVLATETAQPLATPYAQEPAAGICAEAEGSLVSVSLRPDVPDPRCVRVRPDQHLNLKNETDQTLQVNLGRFQAELDPGEEVTFDAPFGDYLAPGVHLVTTSAPPGGPAIWLMKE